jgi:hypothetical protein
MAVLFRHPLLQPAMRLNAEFAHRGSPSHLLSGFYS